MTEQTDNNQHVENQPPEGGQPTNGEHIPVEEGQIPENQTPVAQPPKKFKLNIWQFAAGFLGWFLVTLLVYGQKMDGESLMLCGGVMFLVNVVVLIFLFVRSRSIGMGMLAALGVNLVISLILGLVNNAMCFIPFYKRP